MGCRILVAEDEPYILESLTFLLKRAGYEVVPVVDGAAIMSAIRESHPDLVILDVMLPSANGFDVIRDIRGTPGLSELSVLALTAKGQDADRRRMLDLGANDFVTKPYSNKDLMNRIARLLEQGPLVAEGARGA